MYKHNKIAAIMISLVMVFSVLLSSFSVVYAGLPPIKPPGTNITGPEGTTLQGPPFTGLKKVEAPARAQGVAYEFQPNIKRLPATLEHNFKPILLDDFASFDKAGNTLEKQFPILGSTFAPPVLPQGADGEKQGEELLGPDKINGIKYPPGSKFMVLPKSAASTFVPKANEIYINEDAGSAIKILETGNTDDEGNSRYVVETPKLTDIFQSYTIPKQDIKLTTGNIAYLAPGVELDPKSGMQRNIVASADDGFISDYKYEGNKHILNLTKGKMIFQYPSKEDREKTEEEKKKAEKEKFKGDWWEKEQGTDLRGVQDESSLTVEVKVKEGSIVIEDPTFHADFDLNALTTHVSADFYFDSKVTADVTFEGDLKFNKTVETCIFGYDIDLGKVLGKEKSNKAFVGIFLVLGVNGEVHVEVRTITTGSARAGYAYKAYGYGFIPYFVGPYVTYRPSGFDMNFTVDGEIHASLACVPQVGVIIWGTEIGALQIWLGFKSDAVFSASGGGGSSGNASIQAKGSIGLDAFGELIGYLFGKKYSIFRIDYPLYRGEWAAGTSVSGGGGDMVYNVVPQFLINADAYRDYISGKIAFDTSGKAQPIYSGNNSDSNSTRKPYANGPFVAEVWSYSTLKHSIPGVTDGAGRVIIHNPQSYDIRPTDTVYINIADSPVIEVDNKKYKVAGKSKEIKATVPFTKLDFNVDSFNDIITGTVSGKYSGPVDLKVVDKDFNQTAYKVNATNGIFSLKTPINERTYNVWAEINFEGSRFPDNQGVCRTPNLDALEINFYNDYAEEAESEAADNGSGIIMPKPNTPSIIKQAQDKLDKTMAFVDDEGNKMIRPEKIFGTITNKGDMGWVESQGDNYVRTPGFDYSSAEPFRGSVKITAIPVERAVKDLLDLAKNIDIPFVPDPKPNIPVWTATAQAKQAIELKFIKDSRSPVGYRIEQIPTSAATFEFNKPEAFAYNLLIEHEGLTKSVTYNPFIFHGEGGEKSIEDFIGPLQKAVTLVTEEKKDAITNPAENLGNIGNIGNTGSTGGVSIWQSSWNTNLGKIQLSQSGTAVTGTITGANNSITIEGFISGNKFTGSFYDGVQIGTVEFTISADGKTMSGNLVIRDMNGTTKSFNGTKMLGQ